MAKSIVVVPTGNFVSLRKACFLHPFLALLINSIMPICLPNPNPSRFSLIFSF